MSAAGALLLALLALLAPPPAAGTEEVAAAAADLGAARATRDRLAGEEERLAAELSAVDGRVRDLTARAARTAKDLESTRRERAALAAELSGIKKYFLENRLLIARRIVAVNRRADLSTLGGSLELSDPVAFFDHLHYGVKVLAADAAFLREHSARIETMRRATADLAAREEKERELSARLAAERASLERDSARLTRLLSDLHKAARALELKLAEHRDAEGLVDATARQIRDEPSPPPLPEDAAGGEPAPAPAQERGGKGTPAKAARINFEWPFPGRKREVLSFFGRQTDPVFNIEFANSGIDIRAAEGDPVCAAAAGIVRYRGRMKGLGYVAMIEHAPDTLSLYSRLAEVSVGMGQRVAAGEAIGAVGPADRPGTSPFLHFEIRRNGESVDPMDFF